MAKAYVQSVDQYEIYRNKTKDKKVILSETNHGVDHDVIAIGAGSRARGVHAQLLLVNLKTHQIQNGAPQADDVIDLTSHAMEHAPCLCDYCCAL